MDEEMRRETLTKKREKKGGEEGIVLLIPHKMLYSSSI